MSSTTPAPEVFGSMRVGDIDTRARDWSADLVPVGDSITSVVAVPITRRDGTTAAADLVWTPPASVDDTGQIVTIALRAVTAGTYIVPIEVQTEQGRTLYRDAYLTVAPLLG